MDGLWACKEGDCLASLVLNSAFRERACLCRVFCYACSVPQSKDLPVIMGGSCPTPVDAAMNNRLSISSFNGQLQLLIAKFFW